MSLVEVLIATSILLIISTDVGALIITMQQRMSFVEKKSDSIGLKNELMVHFSNERTCTCLLNTTYLEHFPNVTIDPHLKFDSSVVDGSQSFPVSKIRSACGNSSFVLYEDGKILPSNLKINSIRMANLKPTGNPKEWRGEWTVSFDSGSSSPPLKPITIPQVFIVDDSTVADTRVVSCGSFQICSPQQALESGVCVNKCNSFQYWNSTTGACVNVWGYRIAYECGSDHFTRCHVCGADVAGDSCRLCDSDGSCNNSIAITNICKTLHPHDYRCP